MSGQAPRRPGAGLRQGLRRARLPPRPAGDPRHHPAPPQPPYSQLPRTLHPGCSRPGSQPGRVTSPSPRKGAFAWFPSRRKRSRIHFFTTRAYPQGHNPGPGIARILGLWEAAFPAGGRMSTDFEISARVTLLQSGECQAMIYPAIPLMTTHAFMNVDPSMNKKRKRCLHPTGYCGHRLHQHCNSDWAEGFHRDRSGLHPRRDRLDRQAKRREDADLTEFTRRMTMLFAGSHLATIRS